MVRFPRAEPETRPEPTAEPESHVYLAPNAEPVPEWPAAKYEWGEAWELHWIGFGVAFLLIAVWAVFAVLRARKSPLLLTRRFCYAINFLLIVFGTSRSLSLFLYPYEMVENVSGTPVVLQRLLFSISHPCIVAGFTLIHFAFLEAAKVTFATRRMNSLRFIIGVITLHFSLVIVAVIITSFVPNTVALVIICMFYFIVCSLVVSASVFYSGYMLMHESRTHRRTMRRISVAAGSNPPPYCNKESNTAKVMHVTMVTAVLGVVCACLQIYAMAGIFKVRAEGLVVPKPWPWWAYMTAFRFVELGLAGTMAYTVSQPKKKEAILECCISLPFLRAIKRDYADGEQTPSDENTRCTTVEQRV